MRTVAIETSCDDTSVSIVSYDNGKFTVESLLSYAQLAHQKWGGVVPELAARSHTQKLPELIDALAVDRDEIDCISVTAHPGLPSALTVGVTVAYTLGTLYEKPVVPVHHIMGHVFSVFAGRGIDTVQFPYCCVTVSGGHNDIYLVEKSTKQEKNTTLTPDDEQRHKRNHIALGGTLEVGPYTITKLAQTTDDAAGEVFDKVARMLGGPYPGGKRIDDQAVDHGVALAKSFTVPRLHDGLWSFSGLKSQVHNLVEQTVSAQGVSDGASLPEEIKQQIAYNFQEAVCKGIVRGLHGVLEDYQIEHGSSVGSIGVVGGVSANSRLRTMMEQSGVQPLLPEKFVYCTDNAAMIGVVGLLQSDLIYI